MQPIDPASDLAGLAFVDEDVVQPKFPDSCSRLRLNFEFNVECYSLDLARELEDLIDQKIKSSTPFTLKEIGCRSLPVKLRDGLARLASPYL